MGYPVRSAGYMFCYNRSMIHLASVFSGGSFGREEEDFDLTQGNFCIMVYLPDVVPKMDIDRTKFLSAMGEKSVRFVSEIGQIGGDFVVTVSLHLLPRAFRQQRTL